MAFVGTNYCLTRLTRFVNYALCIINRRVTRKVRLLSEKQHNESQS